MTPESQYQKTDWTRQGYQSQAQKDLGAMIALYFPSSERPEFAIGDGINHGYKTDDLYNPRYGKAKIPIYGENEQAKKAYEDMLNEPDGKSRKQDGLESILGSQVSGRNGAQGYSSDGDKLRSSYQSFKQSDIGKRLLQYAGDAKIDGYGIKDLGPGAIAASEFHSDGKRYLIWNRIYEHVLNDPKKYAKTFLEAMAHEHIHLTGDLSETSTYNRTAQFYKGIARQSPGGLANHLYQSIAVESAQKANIYGEHASPWTGLQSSYGGIPGMPARAYGARKHSPASYGSHSSLSSSYNGSSIGCAGYKNSFSGGMAMPSGYIH